MENTEDPGLVIYSKTGRTLEDIARSVDLPPEAGSADHESHHIVFSPGSIRLKRLNSRSSQKSSNYAARKAITGWSRKSRSNMVSRFATLDYSPMLTDPNRLAVMITLTYPGDWLTVAPTSQHAKNHLHAFRKQFERRFGQPFYGLWKAEFQRRGAVHFHIFCVAPVAIQEFREWVALSWSSIVNHPDEDQRAKHQRAGTAVDIAPAAFIGDTRMIATYFSKHSSPSFGIKNYQNQAPEEWIKSGSVGRFWGYWKLKPIELEARLTEEEIVQIARLLRKWFRSKGFIRRERVMRINQHGVIRFRNVRRRSSRLSHTYGFLVVAEPMAVASDIERFLSLYRDVRK